MYSMLLFTNECVAEGGQATGVAARRFRHMIIVSNAIYALSSAAAAVVIVENDQLHFLFDSSTTPVFLVPYITSS